MKQYTIKEFNDKELLNESKLKEASFMVNTVQDAQETIAKCIQLIAKKKNMNVSACMSIIGDGIISGIDSINEVFPKASESNPVQFEAKKRVIAGRLSRKIMAYAKTK
jgi:Glu-tRNA(Gln) amidotransferase subunit E-like FAD-binding protein